MTKKTNILYKNLIKKEEERVLIQIIDTLLDSSLPYSGKHRKEQWEKGWGENLKSGNLKPKYFGKYPITRLNGKLVKGVDEQKALYTIVDELGKKYFKNVSTIIEFGCGTGHNLLRMRNINKNARLVGCDWANSSQKIVSKLGKGFYGFNFDFFNPRYPFNMTDSGVYTVAALEQIGTKYDKFVKLLLLQKPSVVIHIEPIPELLDPSKLLDYLSIRYMEKRKYLSGYLDYLRKLEKQKKINILEAKRSGIGSMYIDGYSVIIWKPL